MTGASKHQKGENAKGTAHKTSHEPMVEILLPESFSVCSIYRHKAGQLSG
jgi:hypothetical protein